jgi:D-Tyr-tRNAtyr deacylase
LARRKNRRPSPLPRRRRQNEPLRPRPRSVIRSFFSPRLLIISQFTLFASTRKGTRPSWDGAARPDHAIPLYEKFCELCTTALGRPVATGRFGADMQVSLVNDGPVTLLLDTAQKE